MSPLYRTLAAVAALATLTACGDDRSVNPVAEVADLRAATATTASTMTARYDLIVGQSVRIVPKTTTRTSRLRWTSANTKVASVSSTGTVNALAAGVAVVTAASNGVLESYEVVVVPPTVTSFSLQPKTGVTLNPGQTQQYATNTTWSDGQARPVSVTYTATGGTISSTGLFTAGNLAGTFMVIATCACTTPAIADTALVSVVVPQLTSLTVSPKTASVNAGATQQFAVTARWNTGATTVPPVTWSATGGSVSASGLYTAPTTAGTYRVIVAHTNGTVRDTATVTVTGGGTTSGGDTSAVGSMFFSDNFDAGVRTSANGFRWTDAAAVSVSNERAFSGQYALRFEYGAALPTQDGMSEQRFDMGRYLSDVTVEYMLYVPTNFKHRRDDGVTNNKFIMLWRDKYSDVSGGTWRLGWEYLRASDSTSLGRFMSSRWDVNMLTDWGDWGTPAPNLNPNFIGSKGPIVIGQWNRIKLHARAASSRTASDGVLEFWVNNVLILAIRNAKFHNAFSTPADAVLRNGYLMGWANSGFAERTVFFIDDVKFSTAP